MPPPTPTLKVGLFGVGLDTCWPQFEGLEEKLSGYVEQVAGQLSRPDVKVVHLGLNDTQEQALEAGHAMRRADMDLILLYGSTGASGF